MGLLKRAETDWMASKPVFYNKKTNWISYNINDVIDWKNLEFSSEGLRNYLEFGYSVFGHTPIRDVCFLPPCSLVEVGEEGKLSVLQKEDSAQKYMGIRRSGKDVLELLESRIRDWEKGLNNSDIIIPTSGGFDSRLLNLMIFDKSRIKSFTYGISLRQKDSYEAICASKLSEILHTDWEQIPIGKRTHCYINNWLALYGPSVHAHGMYQMEFYHQIRRIIGAGRQPVLSGVIGDLWSGNVRSKKVPASVDDVGELGLAHGISVNPARSLLQGDSGIKEEWFESNKYLLKDEEQRILSIGRFKIILLSYLMEVPKKLGFQTWSPFLEEDIALSMLNMDWSEKGNRRWQQNYFRLHKVNLEDMNLKCSHQNVLDMYALYCKPLFPLNIALLREIIDPELVECINRILSTVRLTRPFFYLGGFKYYNTKVLRAYSAYMVLKPLEYVLSRRNEESK